MPSPILGDLAPALYRYRSMGRYGQVDARPDPTRGGVR